MDDATKTINILIETERLADKILQNKHEIVALDKRRQDTREAIRELGKCEEKKAWITVGSMLIEMKKEMALELLQTDQNVIHQEINKLRSDQKVLLGQHRDLEFSDPLKGFDLNPLSRDEIGVLRTNLPGL
ncbi:p53 and DNA damage-regulated protein 1 [Bradysia coprophila]|uniref:p53 and DNA damage-regulated protein 1 n=1 Tax=Bradysia coprophila TaxID=38358 RepID=UPI00187DBF4A|nr:p53 and DNA damage-regulated protein 1 [Bradysia coprophila]XP_037035980.1 p53 and DNA damage-regulated protein 1 [Bradysia coprophila]